MNSNYLKTIRVNLKDNSYPIYIGYKAVENIPIYLQKTQLGNFGLIITSPRIHSLHKQILKKIFRPKSYKIIEVIDGERAKSKKWVFKVVNEIIKVDNWYRRLFIVCLGGGTVGDLAGFVAAVYKRGIPYIQIPTTLLAQIDSSIGGKTAIDTPEAKNILGTFYQPKAVFIDPIFLSTLPSLQFQHGLAEAIKYGIIKDKEFFYFLKNNYLKVKKQDSECIQKLVWICAQIKAKIVERDEKEKKGLRTILNFGHTFAHALESAEQYKKISHGRAVSLGMLYAAQLSLRLRKCSKKAVKEIYEILKLFSLPTTITFNQAKSYKSLVYDKKFISGKIRMVLLRKIGQVEVVDEIAPESIKKTLKIFSRGCL